jgi:hypothetical protein
MHAYLHMLSGVNYAGTVSVEVGSSLSRSICSLGDMCSLAALSLWSIVQNSHSIDGSYGAPFSVDWTYDELLCDVQDVVL